MTDRIETVLRGWQLDILHRRARGPAMTENEVNILAARLKAAGLVSVEDVTDTIYSHLEVQLDNRAIRHMLQVHTMVKAIRALTTPSDGGNDG